MKNAYFLTDTVSGQILGSHFLEHQKRMTNTVQTEETTLLQLLLVITHYAAFFINRTINNYYMTLLMALHHTHNGL